MNEGAVKGTSRMVRREDAVKEWEGEFNRADEGWGGVGLGGAEADATQFDGEVGLCPRKVGQLAAEDE